MTSYADAGQPADFEVRYRFFPAAEGGRHSGPPFQHYRCDWSYESDDIDQTGIYQIFPEFLAEDGSVFPEDIPVPPSGLATMWILSHEMRIQVHRSRIREGVRGYFREGAHRVAQAVVTRVIGLHTNTDPRRKK
jgi:hypothetical protein